MDKWIEEQFRDLNRGFEEALEGDHGVRIELYIAHLEPALKKAKRKLSAAIDELAEENKRLRSRLFGSGDAPESLVEAAKKMPLCEIPWGEELKEKKE